MIYQFQGFELDSANFRLIKDGKILSVEPQVFNLIAYLVENRSRLVTRNEVFETLWKGREVLDASLSNHIKSARAVLGDNGESQKIIKTFRGRGYQFVAPVEEKQISQDSTPSNASVVPRLKTYIFALLGLVIISVFLYTKLQPTTVNTEVVIKEPSPLKSTILEQKSIAVLPFENRSNLKSDEFFTDGIHDDLLTQISKIQAIKTISRTSVMTYRNTTKNIREIGRELGVSTLLEGGIQRAEGQIRINVQLIDAATDQHLWSETYTREMNVENIFLIQSEIVQTIAKALKSVLSLHEQERINRIPTQNMAALESYFLAKSSANKHTGAGYQEAIEHLQQAIKIDPKFAIAYAELGSLALGQVYWAGSSPESQIATARPLIEKAIELDGEMSTAYTALGSLKEMEGDNHSATLAFQKAIELNSNNASAHAAYGRFYLWKMNDLENAAMHFYKAQALNPKNDSLGIDLSRVLIKMNRFSEAQKLLEEIIARKPDYPAAYWELGFIYFYANGQIAKTLHTSSITTRIDPSVPVRAILFAWGYIHLGDKERAAEWLAYALTLTSTTQTKLSVEATLHELRNEPKQAFEKYMKIDATSTPDIFRLLVLAIELNRTKEALTRLEKLFPALFQPNAKINEHNFTLAFMLGKILKLNGEQVQANYFLTKSLEIAQRGKYEGWGGRYKNWESQIYLTLGDKKSALAAFNKTVAQGFHSVYLITDPIYQPLQGEPEYQKIYTIVKSEIKKARDKLKQLEAQGEIVLPSQLKNVQ